MPSPPPQTSRRDSHERNAAHCPSVDPTPLDLYPHTFDRLKTKRWLTSLVLRRTEGMAGTKAMAPVAMRAALSVRARRMVRCFGTSVCVCRWCGVDGGGWWWVKAGATTNAWARRAESRAAYPGLRPVVCWSSNHPAPDGYPIQRHPERGPEGVWDGQGGCRRCLQESTDRPTNSVDLAPRPIFILAASLPFASKHRGPACAPLMIQQQPHCSGSASNRGEGPSALKGRQSNEKGQGTACCQPACALLSPAHLPPPPRKGKPEHPRHARRSPPDPPRAWTPAANAPQPPDNPPSAGS